MDARTLPIALKSGLDLLEALQHQRRQPHLATQVPELDRLQGGGLRRGSFVSVSGDCSSGRFAMALAILSAATRAGESAAFVDAGNQLDPARATQAGVDLQRLLWVRPPSAQQALLSTEIVLETGFSLVVLDLGTTKVSLREFPEAAWWRLSRAASEHKSIFLVITGESLQSVVPDLLIQTHRSRALWSLHTVPLLSGLSVEVLVRQRKGERHEQMGTVTFEAPESLGR